MATTETVREGGQVQEYSRPRRPLLSADLTSFFGATDPDPGARSDAAHASAACVLRAGRERDVDLRALIELDETVGIDELSALWRNTERGTLPATLWTLYLLRAWCRRRGDEIARLWHAGRPHAEVDAAVAGLPGETGSPDAARFADELLEGVFHGDLGVALQRAAAFFRVVAAARADLPDTGHAAPELGFGALGTAGDLERAAASWRDGTLH